MSRRASFFARHHPGEKRVRFPDELVFHDCVKESEEEMVVMMLRRVSLEIDVNRINMAGMTALHQVSQRPLTYHGISWPAFLQPEPIKP